MPVTFSPAQHPATSKDVQSVTATQILQKACPNQFEQVDRIMQYSVGGRSGPLDMLFKIVPNENGFVNTVLSAYNHHYALVIRPDDVWLAIVSQFSFYVNANAELLRANFVAHEGKRELEIFGDIPPDFGALSRQMGEMIHKNVVDPSLRDWILPQFSTTTTSDTTMGSMLMMATMKKYFNYKMSFLCGLPRVTLEGKRQDWELVLRRLEKLKEYGLETTAWYHLLVPVVSRFLQAFDNPNSPDNYDFWQKVACNESFGSGSSYWSGWITAFCVFSTEGRWCGPKLDTNRVQSKAPESMSSRRFWASYTRPFQESRPHLTLDGTEYPIIDTTAVPSGYAEVDVLINNNGSEFPCVIVAGLVGMGFSSSRDLAVSSTGKNDTVRPVIGWWMYAKVDETRRREDAQHQSHSSAQPTIMVPPVEAKNRKEQRLSSSQSTRRLVAGQSYGSRGQDTPSTPGGTSSPVRGRRNSESVITGDASVRPEPMRSRRNSFWRRMFKI
ncbi:hypothetical protein C8R44DRAFT_783999 [Mycena epipterygia]|nr:hypothetical protein C8R44DRAFT_783999 [Mycena epipterygia]